METAMQELLDRVPHIDTSGMSYEEWKEKRKESMGGSEAGSIMGLSDYGSRLTVYLEKKSLVDSGESRAAHRGKILEPVIRQFTQEEFPALKIEKMPYMFFHPEFPYMSANVDGLIWSPATPAPLIIDGQEIIGLGGHEIKSSKTGYGFGKNEIPDSYYAQVQHYAAVLGLDWFLLSVYILETEEIRHYPIKRNEDFIRDLKEQEKYFWDTFIVPSVMPAATGLDSEEDMITGLFEGSNTIVLDEPQRHLCADYLDLNKAIKELEERKKNVKVNLMEAVVQKSNGKPPEKKATAIAGPYSVLWSFYERKSLDTDALKKDGLYDKYAKVSVYDRFTVTEKK
ncbi:hypothetical protein FACS189447_09520 [Spirochaetia bacterium]|nr:hypothetical protein FACS189447_09520 [Spirochaetia bacterium]